MTLATIMLATLFINEADAGTRADMFVFADNEQVTPAVSVFTYTPIKESNWAISTFGLALPMWAQVYGGPAWSPNDWLTLSAGVGIETVPEMPLRWASSMLLMPDRFFLLSIYEGGGSGHWWKGVYTYNLPILSDRISFGVMTQRYQGTGPRTEITFGNGGFYFVPLWQEFDWKPDKMHAGVFWKW